MAEQYLPERISAYNEAGRGNSAGVLNMRGLPKNLGMVLLAIWLILIGLVSLLNLRFTGSQVLMDLLAIAAGLLILLRR